MDDPALTAAQEGGFCKIALHVYGNQRSRCTCPKERKHDGEVRLGPGEAEPDSLFISLFTGKPAQKWNHRRPSVCTGRKQEAFFALLLARTRSSLGLGVKVND